MIGFYVAPDRIFVVLRALMVLQMLLLINLRLSNDLLSYSELNYSVSCRYSPNQLNHV